MTNLPPFEHVVAEHGARVLRVCRAVLGSDTEAEDAWSETFLAALRAWPTRSDDEHLEGWLVTIAHRKALDVVRARRRRAVPVDHPPEAAARGDGDQGAATDDLRVALAALPDKQRAVLAYHYLGGLAYAEIAVLLGGTAEAARRAAADGRTRLRATLTRGDENVDRA
jgi:RNA polymerase sigma factor (sigma-70 family)